MEKKPGKCLNNYAEISIGGVVYRVKSVFAGKGQMGELLDLAVMEKPRKGPVHQSVSVL